MSARLLRPSLKRLCVTQCLLFLAVLTIFFACTSPYFFSIDNLKNILTASTVIGLLALGATLVIASGHIDLSSAGVLAVCGTVCAWCLQKAELPPVLAIACSVGLGGLFGFVTGWLINITKAPSFVVSLGIMNIARAAAYIVADGVPIYGLPESTLAAGQGQLAGIPVPVIVFALGAFLAWILLLQTRFGIHMLALGDNPNAAEAMGLSVNQLRLKTFTLAGIYSGIAGIVFTMRTNSGDPTAGQSYELIAITAVILGGANLFGGRATIVGTVLGVLCLGVLQNGLNLLAVNTYYQILFVGLVLLAAAFLSRVGYRR